MSKIRLLICVVSAVAFLALGVPVWSQSTLHVDALELYGGTYSSAYSDLAALQTVVPASADSGWTLVPASDWRTRAPGLVGNRVEVSGNLSTQLMVNPRSSFSNTGWMRDAGNKELATVLFDQIGDAELAWMRKNKCSETCAGVFVRGVVVSGRGSRAPVLRMIDVSFESRAGGAAASMVQLDSGHADTPAVEKQLLPPGGVPTTLGPSAVTQMPAATPDTTAGKSVYEGMQDHSLKMRQRDLNWEKGMIPGPERPPDFETNYRSIRDTRLSKVFTNYPWNTGRNAWPRVALVVEQEATGGTGALGFLRPGEKIKDRCWQLRARLWTGPAASQEIAPFNWCLSEMRFNVPYNAVALWGKTLGTRAQNTGLDRTLGPNPPALPVPRLHYDNGSYSDTIMLGNILLDMSFSFGVPDGRVWVADRAKDTFTDAAKGVASDTAIKTAPSEPKSGAAQAIDSDTKDTKEQRSAKPSANSYIPRVEIKQGADKLKQTLEGMPYTSEGKGAVVYVFEFSDCPAAQLRYKDWKGKLQGVELRHFLYPTSQRTANEAAALLISRDVNDYYAFMEHRKTAPDATKTPQSIDVFNSIVTSITTIIIPILHKNGWTDRNLVSPNYFWEAEGKWYSDGGYGYKEHGRFESIMNMAVLNKAPQQNPQTPDTNQSVNTQPAVSNTVSDVSAIAASTTDEKQPDILGIKLGVSTPLEVKAAIARQNPAFTVEESPAKLSGYIRTGRIVPAPVDVPNGKYVALINAVARSSKLVSCHPKESQVDCERIEVWFAAPPNAPTARSVRRVINYIHGPTVENVERSVIEKYGEPGFRQNADKVDFMTYPARYVWAWSADGKPFALPGRQPPHPCAAVPDQDRIVGSSFGNQSQVTALLNAGCPVVLYLSVVSKNGVVSSMTYFAVDASGIVNSNTKTATFVNDYIAAVEKKELEDAAKVKVNP